MTHLLFIAYHMPPAGGIPIRRAMRFLRHLPDHGIRCSLLSADSPYDPYHPADVEGVSTLARLNLERTIRAPARAGAERVAAFGWRALRAALDRRSPSGGATAGPASGRFGALRRAAGGTLFFPDPKARWARSAEHEALDVFSADPWDVILATAYPWSSLVVAQRLAERTDTPWFADLRDAWVDNPRGLFASERHRTLEQRTLLRASGIVAATQGIEDALRRRYGDALPPTETIYTGFDEIERGGDAPCRDHEKLVITYTGTFNDALPPSPLDQSPYALLQAIESLDTRARSGLEVRLVGRLGEKYRRWIEDAPRLDCVRAIGPVSHDRALAEQRAADVLLVVVGAAPENAGVLTGKFVEYVGTGRPIWALAPEGELTRHVRSVGGRVDPPADTDAIATAILEWSDLKRRDALPRSERARAWSASARAARLAELLRSVAA